MHPFSTWRVNVNHINNSYQNELLNQFPPFCYFPDFSQLSNYWLLIEYHVHRSDAATPVRYENDSKNRTGILHIKVALTENLRNKRNYANPCYLRSNLLWSHIKDYAILEYCSYTTGLLPRQVALWKQRKTYPIPSIDRVSALCV